MKLFPEDDELGFEREIEEADQAIDTWARDMRATENHRNRLRKQLTKRQVDPLIVKSLELAHNMGQAMGANEALVQKIDHLTKRIEIRDKEIERTADRDSWKRRAEAAEATIERSKKRRKR